VLHGFGFLGLAFVLPGVVSPELPAAFAQPVAFGDFITAILALLALATLGTRTGTPLTWVFNIFGTADLLFAFYLGSRIALPDTSVLLGAGYFILAAYVPLLLITHGLAFPHTATSQGCRTVTEQSTYRLNRNGLWLGKKNRLCGSILESRVCFRKVGRCPR
jgi:hypothetical protein